MAYRDLGLTRQQFRAYSLWFSGMKQSEVAGQMKLTQQAVSKLIKRAIKRKPDLPKPPPQKPRVDVVSSFDRNRRSVLSKVIGC